MGWSHRAPPRRRYIATERGPDAEQYAADMERRAKRLAATFGLCGTCKRDVGDDGIHEWSCTAVPTERRENRGHAPGGGSSP